jgi:DNA-binding transcriptional ArsR family regulator
VATYEGAPLQALGDPTRRAIFECLALGPRSVGELAREVPVSRPAVSQHLRVLKEAGLVSERRAGTRRIYQLKPEGVAALRAYFDRFWNQALAAFKQAAEADWKGDRMTYETKTEEQVQATVTVEAGVERAFVVFTRDLGSWWPPQHHIGKQPMATAIMEPRAGGRWFERAADGSECQWGQVLAWEPPARVVLAWQIGPTWQVEPDLAKASEVEVRFTAEGPNRTRVELVHSGFERHGEGGAAMRKSVAAEGGWQLVLDRYVKAVEGKPLGA